MTNAMRWAAACGWLMLGCAGEGGTARAAAPDEASESEPTRSCAVSAEQDVGGRALRRLTDESNVVFVGSLSIDADGAPRAYHPGALGLDRLGNAGRPGSWWGLVTDAAGQPVVQGPADPAPGFFVSRTSLEDRSRAERDPRRYVDASSIPYIVLPGGAANRQFLREAGVRLGDLAVVHNRRTGRTAFAIWADTGPAHHLGEGSIALAEALGYDNTSPRSGGTEAEENLTLVLGGSGRGWPRTRAQIEADAAARFAAWGGEPRLLACR